MELDFWLERSRWFGMTMYPGYDGGPYHSPIQRTGFQLLDDRIFCLDFINLAYAHGVQEFSVDFEVLRGTMEYQICIAAKQLDRAYVFVPLTASWIATYFSEHAHQRLFDEQGVPICEALLRLRGY
ncbi:hypothetical protein ACFFF7_02600 [Novosphingobium aquiterrae]|uniref:Uncharacterized protein n=2 Tax=Novosphingobium aquiterrae TaxID=624388 RepID=A0ABV6PEP6_9SPHN